MLELSCILSFSLAYYCSRAVPSSCLVILHYQGASFKHTKPTAILITWPIHWINDGRLINPHLILWNYFYISRYGWGSFIYDLICTLANKVHFPYSNIGDHMERICITLDPCLSLKGDILIKCYNKRMRASAARELIFRCQFHTCAISNNLLLFNKHELDEACTGEQMENLGTAPLPPPLNYSHSPEAALKEVLVCVPCEHVSPVTLLLPKLTMLSVLNDLIKDRPSTMSSLLVLPSLV